MSEGQAVCMKWFGPAGVISGKEYPSMPKKMNLSRYLKPE